ncbi:hypothetical protein OEZ85_007510 [Tetradesmus obliquus]|uniref:U3 small nucleolar RNA-associated protein 6 n=1 Tax=Tetradesmus obliquus TaxID=3088 RepID=A0ABY8TGF8_TETOB|nr:hypothetical protein OEZ85_007510 [Tetradesmus obliquus]
MADTVRYMMEEMIPELEDMVKQQYFSKQEVKQIVKRRQDFEYLLKRRSVLKEDFLRYIEYESKLEELRQHRRKGLDTRGKKKSLADYAIVRRIHFIFERAVRRFRSDLALWTAWLEFCRASSSNRRLGRVVGRALQVHPTEPGLWVYAAAWEFEANGNPGAARALMQQGLRMCRYSEKMWLDYFDMELMYVEKLVARRRILGLDVPQPDGQQQQQQQSGAAAAGKKRQRQDGADAEDAAGTDPAAAAEDDGEGPEEAAERAAAAAEAADNLLLAQPGSSQPDAAPQDLSQDPQAAVRAVLTGAVAKLVFQNALKAAASSKGGSSNYLKPSAAAAAAAAGSGKGLGFRAGFLEVLGRYRSPGVAGLRQEVLDSIRQDFPEEPEAADLLARAACHPADPAASQEDVQQAVQEFERLLGGSSTTPSSTAAAAAAGGGRQSKRRKSSAAVAAAAADAASQQQQQQAVQLPQAAAVQLYRLYCAYLAQRLEVLLGDEARVLEAAGCAQQLFKLMLRAHEAAAADVELYQQWVALACKLQQSKVALRAARLACEAHPKAAAAWQLRLQQEAAAKGSKASSSSSSAAAAGSVQLLDVIKQGLGQVPAAKAEVLWLQAFELCCDAPGELQQLQQLLLSTVTRTAAKGPARGGLGAAAGACLTLTWQQQGADAARALWQRLLLLPPAGGDMFSAMVHLEAGETAAASQAAQSADALQRVRAVYDAWCAAYGSSDAELWVQYALFEQAQGRQGPGRVYWRAVKAVEDPDEFIQQYRSRVGLV